MTLYVAKKGIDPDITDQPEDDPTGGTGDGGWNDDVDDPNGDGTGDGGTGLDIDYEPVLWPPNIKPPVIPSEPIPRESFPPGWDKVPSYGGMVVRQYSYDASTTMNSLRTSINAVKIRNIVRDVGPLLACNFNTIDVNPALFEDDPGALIYQASTIIGYTEDNPPEPIRRATLYGAPWKANGYTKWFWDAGLPAGGEWIDYEDDSGTYSRYWRSVWRWNPYANDPIEEYLQMWTEGGWSNFIGYYPPESEEEWDGVTVYARPLNPSESPEYEKSYGKVFDRCVLNGFGRFMVDPAPLKEDLVFRCLTRVGFCIRNPQTLDGIKLQFATYNAGWQTSPGEVYVGYSFTRAPVYWSGVCGYPPNPYSDPPPEGQYPVIYPFTQDVYSVAQYPDYCEVILDAALAECPESGPMFIWLTYRLDWEDTLENPPQGKTRISYEKNWDFVLSVRAAGEINYKEVTLVEGVLSTYQSLLLQEDDNRPYKVVIVNK